MGNVEGGQPQALGQVAQAHVRLDVHVLAQNQPIQAGEGHVEVVLGALLAAVHAVVDHAAVGGVVGGLCLDGLDDALPHLGVVHPGVDGDSLALVQGADVQLGHGALHAELPGGQHADKGLGLAVGVGGGGLVDLFHHALHLAVDLGVLQGFLQLVDFLLLGLGVVFLGFNLQLYRLDLHGVGVLLILAGLLFLFFQIILLVLQGGDGVGDALQIQLGLVQAHLHLLGVIAEQGVPRGHLVALGDVDFRHSLGVVLFDFVGGLGLYHAGEPGGVAGVDAGDVRHRLHIDRRGTGRAPQVPQPEKPQAKGGRGHHQYARKGYPQGLFRCMFHGKMLLQSSLGQYSVSLYRKCPVLAMGNSTFGGGFLGFPPPGFGEGPHPAGALSP